jgi:hypothetical protein
MPSGMLPALAPALADGLHSLALADTTGTTPEDLQARGAVLASLFCSVTPSVHRLNLQRLSLRWLIVVQGFHLLYDAIPPNPLLC